MPLLQKLSVVSLKQLPTPPGIEVIAGRRNSSKHFNIQRQISMHFITELKSLQNDIVGGVSRQHE